MQYHTPSQLYTCWLHSISAIKMAAEESITGSLTGSSMHPSNNTQSATCHSTHVIDHTPILIGGATYIHKYASQYS